MGQKGLRLAVWLIAICFIGRLNSQPVADGTGVTRLPLSTIRAGVASRQHAYVVAKDGVAYVSNPSAGVSRAPFLDKVFRPFGFSADGTYFLYLHENRGRPGFSLYSYQLATGADRPISSGRVVNAAWSPNGVDFAYLAFDTENRLDLWLSDAASAEGRRVASGILDAEYLEWSPDGKQLLFAELTPAGSDAFHQSSFDRHIQQYDVARRGMGGSVAGATARFQGGRLVVSGGAAPAEGLSVRPHGAGTIRDLAVAGSDVYATVIEASRPQIHKRNPETGLLEKIHAGDIYAAIEEGVVAREFTGSGVQYTFLARDSAAQPLAGSGASYLMPFQGSAYLVQGGSLFSGGACDGSICQVIAHKALLGFGLDWQQVPEDDMGNADVLAAADGTVAAIFNTVTCNSVTTTCRGDDAYSSSCNDPNFGAGNYVVIAHADGSFTLYAHLKSGSVIVSPGQTVVRGDHIANQGHSGSAGTYNNYRSCGEHLHFQRQTSAVVWGQSIATDFNELACNLSCGAAYVSENTETRLPASSLSLVLAPHSIAGGSTTSGNQVILDAPAPGGGAVVDLTNGAPGVASMPASVTVPAGAVSAAFTISTSGVSGSTPVAISASYNGQTASDTLTVKAQGVSLIQMPTLRVPGATPVSGIEVDLTAVAPASGVVVTLSSSNPAIILPPTVTVPANSASVLFTAQTAEVPTATSGVIAASAGGISRSVTLFLDPLVVKTLNPGTNPLGGGNSSTGLLLLNGVAPPSGTLISLTSSDPAVILPASITVPAGSNSVNFPISSTAISTSVNALLTATYGASSVATHLIVNPIAISTFTISPSNVIAGKPSPYNGVKLTSPAPPGGAIITFTSSDPAAIPPPSLTLAAGVTLSPNFVIQTANVTAPVTATITASYAGSSRTGLLTINPVIPSALLINAPSVGGGNSVVWNKVTLNSPAVGDAAVALSSSDPAATVPATLTIPNGATSALFTISTTAVTAPVTATITATFNATSLTGTLPVNPILLSTVNMAQTTVGGGAAVTGNTLALTYPAPTGGAVISTSSSNPAVASLPATITIPQNATVSSAFTVATTPVSSPSDVTLSFTYAGVTKTQTLTVNPSSISALTLQSAHIAGGLPLTATAKLSGVAPSGGAVVTLTSSNPAVASLPPSVTIAAGSTTSAPFTITTTPVGNSSPVTLTATYAGGSQPAVLTVDPTQATALSLSPSTTGSGNSTLANTVTLNGPAPAGGAVVVLSASNPALVSLPASVTVAAGATTSPAFSITTTSGLTAAATVTITAAYGGATVPSVLTINPIVLTGFTLSVNNLGGGGSLNATVTLSDKAIAPGAVVAVSSSDPAVSVPASVTVPAGAASVTFVVSSSPVLAPTPVTLSVTFGSTTLNASLTITPPALATLLVNTTRTGGGLPITPNSVALNGPAPAAGAPVTLTSSDPSVASVPSSVTIPPGTSGPATFTITTFPVTTNRSAVISASFGGTTKTITLNIDPVLPQRISLTSVSMGGGTITSTNVVVINYPAPPGGLALSLVSSNPSAASVPASVTVPAGQTISAGFTITSSAVTVATPALITASTPAGSASNQVTINPILLTTLTLSPTSVIAGTATTSNSVKISSAAPPGGAVVALSSSDPAVTVPASVTIAAGATTSPLFAITTSAVPAPLTATITAGYAGVVKTATLLVNPIVPVSVPLGSVNIGGGNTITGSKVNLNANATAGGLSVTLTSSDPAASVPATVLIPAGQKAVLFNIITTTVSVPTTVTITATANGTSQTSTLTLNPIQPASVNLNASTIAAGASTTATVTLNFSFPTAVTVTLSSSNPNVTLPPSVTLAAKTLTSPAFTILSAPATPPGPVTISATFNGVTVSSVLTLQ